MSATLTARLSPSRDVDARDAHAWLRLRPDGQFSKEMRCSTFPTTRDAHGEAIRVPLLGRCDPQPWRQSQQAV